MSDPLGEATAIGETAALAGEAGRAARAAITVTAGQLVLGLTSYGFLTVAARSLPVAGFSAVAVLWSLVYGVSGGLCSPETLRSMTRTWEPAHRPST